MRVLRWWMTLEVWWPFRFEAMQYRVIPTQFCVAYQSPRGEWVAVSEGCSAAAAQQQAAKLNAAWSAEQAKKASSQRFVPPAQRRPVRYFPDDVHA